MEGSVKTHQEGSVTPPGGRLLRGADGGLSTLRSLSANFVLLFVTSLVVLSLASGMASSLMIGALVVALAGAPVLHFLLLRPLAGSYEANLKARARANTQGTVDNLTRIPNRRGITTSLLDAMAYASRYAHPLSVALVDLDLLREINRGMGRKAGDKALQSVAAVLGDTLRMPDRAGRYGEEEFLVIMPNTALKNAAKIAERIRTGVENVDLGHNDKKIPLTVSIGATQFRKGEDLERFMLRVDKALAEAKASGRNRVVMDRGAA